MNERFDDPEIEQLRAEKDRLLVERSNQMWHEALKKIDSHYRNEYETAYRTNGRGIHTTNTEGRRTEFNLFKRHLIDGSVDVLKQLGEKITTTSVSSFLSRGKYSIANSTIWNWAQDVGSKSTDLNFTNVEQVRNALRFLWSQPNRVRPPTNQEIAEESGLTEKEVENAFAGDRARNANPSNNLAALRDAGPGRANSR